MLLHIPAHRGRTDLFLQPRNVPLGKHDRNVRLDHRLGVETVHIFKGNDEGIEHLVHIADARLIGRKIYGIRDLLAILAHRERIDDHKEGVRILVADLLADLIVAVICLARDVAERDKVPHLDALGRQIELIVFEAGIIRLERKLPVLHVALVGLVIVAECIVGLVLELQSIPLLGVFFKLRDRHVDEAGLAGARSADDGNGNIHLQGAAQFIAALGADPAARLPVAAVEKGGLQLSAALAGALEHAVAAGHKLGMLGAALAHIGGKRVLFLAVGTAR